MAEVMSRATIRSAAANLAENAPQTMREKLAPFAGRYCDALMAAIDDEYSQSHAQALRIYPQIMRAVGSENEVASAMLRVLGVASMVELESRVQTAQRADGASLESATQQAMQLIARRIKSEPGFREEAARTLFGLDLGVQSEAVVLDEAGPVASKGRARRAKG